MSISAAVDALGALGKNFRLKLGFSSGQRVLISGGQSSIIINTCRFTIANIAHLETTK